LHDFSPRPAAFTRLLRRCRQILPCFSIHIVSFSQRRGTWHRAAPSSPGATVDFLYIAAIVGFLLLTLGLVAGCAALEKKR